MAIAPTESRFSRNARCGLLLSSAALLGGLLLAGCRGIPTRGERAARRNLQTINRAFRPMPGERQPPGLTPHSTLDDYLRFAMLNQPLVEAAYFDWSASVERITVARSLPDPTLTFQSDILDVVKTVMPGLMQQFPGPGKLRAAAAAADAGSREKYFEFETAVLRSAFNLKQAYYRLWFLDQKIQIDHQTLDLLNDLEKIARAQNEVGKATLQDVYRARIERDQLTTDIANLEDSRHSLMAELKGALGLKQDQPNPPTPSQFESTPLDLSGGKLLEVAFERNPRLKAMEADVRRAEADVALARKATVPDFSLGLMADAKSAPTLYRPLAGVTLPIWRDKIAAEIAAAQAAKTAAQARLDAGQIDVTVDFAIQTYNYREATRNLALLENQLIPEARHSLEIAQAGYLGGQISFFNLIDAERTWLNFQLEQVRERTRREIILADVSLSIAGIAPAGAPLLPDSAQRSSAIPNPRESKP
jgi:outer membrane protein, heavy metal efflux system